MQKFIKDNGVLIAWVVSFFSLTGSLFYSEILALPPCILCWYQRIFMYPIVFILGVGIVRKDKNVPYYVLPLSILGSLIALFHYLLQRGIIPDTLAPCVQGISCTSRLIEYFGFVTIPFMSLVSFLIITICMTVLLKNKR